ncbi:phage antirepressor N-terminal domain-containing protein [Pseudomonas oryzihabitans]|uniref:phage antirepressor N-terminal domain-containing protein n=1 Tax=Pseudomonas oryzihabitans TaxID=47885 RepID=UPI002894B3C2|nr:phage antirepressor N-terminal domain-containing protein [Pseudomonas oryzihabitans]MDT3722922.1 phage antirepressor N-terminal domain-containing protein [Pseudomonas oryzihabitans]
MHTAPQLFPVSFHGDTVVLVGQDNEPYVAMKPIVANMGMDWPTQYVKLTERFSSTIGEIPTVGEDGKTRNMICLPLKKLPAWLYSISPNKVAPELREKVIRYQEECDNALWNYWTQGVAERPGAAANANKQIALSRHRLALLKELHRTRDRSLRSAIHEQLAQVSQALGLSVPELNTIGRANPDTPDVLRAFWEAVAYLEGAGERCNHARPTSGKICLSLPDLEEQFRKYGIAVKIDFDLTAALRQSKEPLFIKSAPFDSQIKKKKVRCWIFEP